VLYLSALDALADHLGDGALKQAAIDLRQQLEALGLDDDNGSPVNYAIPVGLNNIGNTCYLNSLLQYLFTVKAVRDVVLNYDDYKMELTDDNIAQRKLGGNKMQMDRGEAVVAHACSSTFPPLPLYLNI
jgi:ubiquitin carboxyl-terminal hydrolase 25